MEVLCPYELSRYQPSNVIYKSIPLDTIGEDTTEMSVAKMYNQNLTTFSIKIKPYNSLVKKINSWNEYLPTLDHFISLHINASVALSSGFSHFLEGGWTCDGEVPHQSDLVNVYNQLNTIDLSEVRNAITTELQKLDNEKKEMEESLNSLIASIELGCSKFPYELTRKVC